MMRSTAVVLLAASAKLAWANHLPSQNEPCEDKEGLNGYGETCAQVVAGNYCDYVDDQMNGPEDCPASCGFCPGPDCEMDVEGKFEVREITGWGPQSKFHESSTIMVDCQMARAQMRCDKNHKENYGFVDETVLQKCPYTCAALAGCERNPPCEDALVDPQWGNELFNAYGEQCEYVVRQGYCDIVDDIFSPIEGCRLSCGYCLHQDVKHYEEGHCEEYGTKHRSCEADSQCWFYKKYSWRHPRADEENKCMRFENCNQLNDDEDQCSATSRCRWNQKRKECLPYGDKYRCGDMPRAQCGKTEEAKCYWHSSTDTDEGYCAALDFCAKVPERSCKNARWCFWDDGPDRCRQVEEKAFMTHDYQCGVNGHYCKSGDPCAKRGSDHVNTCNRLDVCQAVFDNEGDFSCSMLPLLRRYSSTSRRSALLKFGMSKSPEEAACGEMFTKSDCNSFASHYKRNCKWNQNDGWGVDHAGFCETVDGMIEPEHGVNYIENPNKFFKDYYGENSGEAWHGILNDNTDGARFADTTFEAFEATHSEQRGVDASLLRFLSDGAGGNVAVHAQWAGASTENVEGAQLWEVNNGVNLPRLNVEFTVPFEFEVTVDWRRYDCMPMKESISLSNHKELISSFYSKGTDFSAVDVTEHGLKMMLIDMGCARMPYEDYDAPGYSVKIPQDPDNMMPNNLPEPDYEWQEPQDSYDSIHYKAPTAPGDYSWSPTFTPEHQDNAHEYGDDSVHGDYYNAGEFNTHFHSNPNGVTIRVRVPADGAPITTELDFGPGFEPQIPEHYKFEVTNRFEAGDKVYAHWTGKEYNYGVYEMTPDVSYNLLHVDPEMTVDEAFTTKPSWHHRDLSPMQESRGDYFEINRDNKDVFDIGYVYTAVRGHNV